MSGNFLGHVVAVNTEFRNLTKSLDDLFEPQKTFFIHGNFKVDLF